MKIAFWSNSDESCPVSSNLAAVSVAFAIAYPCFVITLENYLQRHNLGRVYNRGRRAEQTEDAGSNYYEGSGMEGLLRRIYRGTYASDRLGTYMTEIIRDHLYYIPQCGVLHNEIFDYELVHCIYALFHVIEESSDLCFINTASNNSLSTKIILEEADLIVVNLSNRPKIIEEFFFYHSSLISNALFILSDYSRHSMLSIKKISGTFHIPSPHIITIPESEPYRNAYNGGYVHEFISRNMNCSENNPNYAFIQAVKRAARLIMDRVEVKFNEKERSTCVR